nr:hypothetical protein [Phycisphaerae bacterium]NIT58907.1 hypothetical protein [Fodinibius sp.]NIW98117.1 hypothetical protein [Phycisphaerae bacterium]NIY27490.1 hypothetical protein [Fodinibius sp.]
PIANDSFERIYFTGESEPRAFANDLNSSPWDQSVDYYKIGAAKPSAAATFSSGHTGGTSYRAYVYTYVTRYGEETGPSPVLSTTTYDTGNVVIDGFTQPPAGYALRTKVGSNAPKIRVYRTNSSLLGAEFQYVGEFDIDAFNFSTGTYTDSVDDADLGEVLPTEDYEGIPSDLNGLIGTEGGYLAGFKGNELYLSEPYLPHAWPDEYRMSFDYDIVGLGYSGSTLFVITEGTPYYLIGTSPETLSPKRIQGFYPCRSKRSIVSTPRGVLYSSYEGLILINQNGVQVVTAKYLSPTDWEEYEPEFIHGQYYGDKYFGFYSNANVGTFIFDFVNDTWTTINKYYQASYRRIAQGSMYLIYSASDTTIRLWEGDRYNYFYYTWKSKKYLLKQDTGFTCGQIIVDQEEYNKVLDSIVDDQYIETINAAIWATGDLQDTFNTKEFNDDEFNGSALLDINDVAIDAEILFSLWVDNTKILERTVTADSYFRIPPKRGRRIEIQLSGYIPIRRAIIAQSPEEL